MIDLKEMCWASDIELTVLKLAQSKAQILDMDYWRLTVDRVEDGIHPTQPRATIQSELRDWEVRCKTEPPSEEPQYDHRPRIIQP